MQLSKCSADQRQLGRQSSLLGSNSGLAQACIAPRSAALDMSITILDFAASNRRSVSTILSITLDPAPCMRQAFAIWSAASHDVSSWTFSEGVLLPTSCLDTASSWLPETLRGAEQIHLINLDKPTKSAGRVLQIHITYCSSAIYHGSSTTILSTSAWPAAFMKAAFVNDRHVLCC